MSKLAVIPLNELERRYEQYDMIPQAILNAPISRVARALRSEVVHGHDDLDEYEGTAAVLQDGSILEPIPIALKHYAGYPPNTTTIYLPNWINDLEKITVVVSLIVQALHLSLRDVAWQRADNPDL